MTKQECLDYLGITKWHEAGYKGQGIKIMSDEKISEDFRTSHTDRLKDVICPTGYASSKGFCHGKEVMVHILMVAPEATCITYPLGGTFSSNSYKSKCVDYILENDVDIFTTSCTGPYPNTGEQKAIQDCIANGCIFFGSAGNEGEGGIMPEIRYDGYWAIGGVKWIDNTWKRVNYSSIGQELDFVTIAEILGVAGTSFCAPVFAGMCGLVQQFFKEKTGRKLTRTEMERFIKDNCKDVLGEGFDCESGHGLFILPDPNTIDVSKYVDLYANLEVNKMFNQNNYPNIPYPSQELPNATVKSGGCGLCCSANVLQHFGMNVDIKSLAEYFCDAGIRANGGTDMAKAAKYIKELTGCEVITSNDERELKKYLSKGAIAIANVDGVNDIFSTEGHFINVIGVNGDTFTIFDVGYYSGKFDSEYRRKYVTLGEENGNIVQYCSADTLNLDTANRNPNYYIFYRKEVEVDMEEPSEWAKKAWEWACDKERKYFDGTNPKGTVTREMLAQVLFNLFGKEK